MLYITIIDRESGIILKRKQVTEKDYPIDPNCYVTEYKEPHECEVAEGWRAFEVGTYIEFRPNEIDENGNMPMMMVVSSESQERADHEAITWAKFFCNAVRVDWEIRN